MEQQRIMVVGEMCPGYGQFLSSAYEHLTASLAALPNPWHREHVSLSPNTGQWTQSAAP
jgi:hypothetical protein